MMEAGALRSLHKQLGSMQAPEEKHESAGRCQG